MRSWFATNKFINNKLTHRMVVPALAVALALSFTAYEFAKPAFAKAPIVSPTEAPLPDSSVSALLALDQAMETLAARVTPAVVNVAVTSRTKSESADGQDMQMPQGMPPMFAPFFNHPMQPQTQIEHGIGSGVIISPDGYIVTNNHVIDGAVDINVTMNDRRILKAKLIGADPLTDLAVIKIEGTNLPNAPWGDSTAASSRSDRARLRQSLWVPFHSNPWHRQRTQPPESVRERPPRARQLHSDRRSHQPRQLRRTAGRRSRRGDRHQHLPRLDLR